MRIPETSARSGATSTVSHRPGRHFRQAMLVLTPGHQNKHAIDGDLVGCLIPRTEIYELQTMSAGYWNSEQLYLFRGSTGRLANSQIDSPVKSLESPTLMHQNTLFSPKGWIIKYSTSTHCTPGTIYWK